jgi:hypothetical protein
LENGLVVASSMLDEEGENQFDWTLPVDEPQSPEQR